MTNAAFAAADWGTTRFRLWLFDADGAVLAERRSDEGLLSAQPDDFAAILETHLAALGAPADLPVIICGMAGSRQGWIEAPYAAVPATLGDILAGAVKVPGTPRDVRIVPGLAQRDTNSPDVMRGEETQLAGASALLGSASSLVCMPGTHSKWVEVSDGKVTGFATFMTGELFSVLSERTILSHSIGAAAGSVQPDSAAFRKACQGALDEGGAITGGLFHIRASTLLLGLQPADAAATLSGLLVGAEIAAARRRFSAAGGRIVLVASGAMRDLYAAALALAGCSVEAIDADEAVRAGLVEAARQNGMIGKARNTR